jgi:hypothetical protein
MAFTRSKASAGSSAASVGGIWMPALMNATAVGDPAHVPLFDAERDAQLGVLGAPGQQFR